MNTKNIMKRFWIPLGIYLIFSLLLGLTALAVVPPFAVISDFADYDVIGQTLANEGTYTTISDDAIVYPPLYPAFLALIYKLFGHSYQAVYLAQFLLLGGIGYLIFLISTTLGLKRGLAYASGLTVVCWPYFILYSLLISSEILFTFLLVLATYCLIQATKTKNNRFLVASGIAAGLAALARSVLLLLPFWLAILIILALLYQRRSQELTTRAFWRPLLLGLIMYSLVVGTWIGWASIQFDRFIPISSNFSYVFSKANETFGYLETTTPTDNNYLGSLLAAKAQNLYLFWNPGASGYHVDQLVAAHPFAAVAVTLYKIAFFVALALCLWSLRSRDWLIWLIGATIAYFWALHTVLFPFPRYTLPIIPFMITLAYYGGTRLIRGYQSNESPV